MEQIVIGAKERIEESLSMPSYTKTEARKKAAPACFKSIRLLAAASASNLTD